MDKPATVKIRKLAKNTFEIYGVVNGKFIKRQYVGYSQKDAISRFQKWIKTQV